MSNGMSLWAVAAASQLADATPLYQHKHNQTNFEIISLCDAVWIMANLSTNARLGFRTAYSPSGFKDLNFSETENGVVIKLNTELGDYKVTIKWPEQDKNILHYTVELVPVTNLQVPFWPRDIVAFPKNKKADDTPGIIHIAQTGGRSGLIYAAFKKPKSGSFLYLQNLTALSDYNIDTQTSAAGIVGGQWPEMGLSLPPAIDKPMQAGKSYVISDAFVRFSNEMPGDQFEISKGFLNALADIYMLLPRPKTKYHPYPMVLKKALYDLQNNKGCWAYRAGHPYLNAYVSDYPTPPEIMVQLAVLLPIHEYMEWSGETCDMQQEIIDGLRSFYNEKLGTVMRWLPSEEDMLDKSEEQKVPMVMDSWYLHHPLLNLARMASAGDKECKDLLLKSVDFAIKVAHHFNYVWPVFYKMDTLEVVKAEAAEGKGGEKDVAGIYAHVMLQMWDLTGDKKYLNEAEKAARSMVQHGFEVFYQANNTVFGAKAMILLYRHTKKELYRDLSYVFLANVFKNIALWECNYGYGKNFPSFFELFPLSDAPYVAVYEEQESFAGMNEYLSYANGMDILPSVNLLLAEFIKYFITRAVYYYPPMLPEDMLSKETKTGELDPKLWIALEDIHDGWEQSGSVGQEVYGAGLAFGIVPRQYIKIPGQDFLVFIDYPVTDKKVTKNKMTFKILGDSQLTCLLCFVTDHNSLPDIKVDAKFVEDKQAVKKSTENEKRIEYRLYGNQEVSIKWSKTT